MRLPSSGAVIVAVSLALSTVGCGDSDVEPTPAAVPTPTPGPPTDFMYVSDWKTSTVLGFSVGEDGKLTPVPGSPFATGAEQARGITADSSGAFVYLVDRAERVIGFRVEDAGRLSRIPGGEAGTGKDPRSIAAHPTLPRLYVTNAEDSTLTVMGFDRTTGAITSSVVVPTASFPTVVDVHPSGRFLYLGAVARVAMHRLRLDGSPGSVREVGPSDMVAARVLRLTPSGEALFVYEDGYNRFFTFFVNENTGALTEPSGPHSLDRQGFMMDFSIDPSGRYLYLDTLTDTVPGFEIDERLRLTPLPGSPTQLMPGTEDALVNLEPKGRFAYIFEGPRNARIIRTCRVYSGVLTSLRTDRLGNKDPYGATFVYR